MYEGQRGLAPRFEFATTLAEQEAQLAVNPLLHRYAASRAALAADPDRPGYHFVSPESGINDPSGLVRWRDRWHLFYLAYPVEYLPAPEDVGKVVPAWAPPHWGHAVSDDLVHWRDLPIALYPDREQRVSTGSVLVDGDRAIAFYPGRGAGQLVAISDDPLLLTWEKHAAEGVVSADSDIWKEGDTYVGLVTGVDRYDPGADVPSGDSTIEAVYGMGVWPRYRLWTSTDLVTWSAAGDLLPADTPLTDRYDEGACPVFERIGDKHILLSFSHKNGGQYLLGDYDEGSRAFHPYDRGRFGHGEVNPGGVHAPQATDDGEGGLIAIHNINEATEDSAWGGIMSLPQHLTLGEDKRLRIAPLEALATLRRERTSVADETIPEGRDWIVEGLEGKTLELDLEIDPQGAHWVELDVLRSPDGEERTSITFFPAPPSTLVYVPGLVDDAIVLDNSRSSTRPDAWPRPPERAIVQRGGENLRLRVFVDRSVVEVFVNERVYLAARVHPSRVDSVGVSLRAHGRPARLLRLDAWRMDTIWP